jgi:hypothetical protein
MMVPGNEGLRVLEALTRLAPIRRQVKRSRVRAIEQELNKKDRER